MASIFTYEPDIPRVSSPWTKQASSGQAEQDAESTFVADHEPAAFLEESGNVTRLEAEPQEGPVEYKLHLLLRPRRNFTSISTVAKAHGPRYTKFNGPVPRNTSEIPTPPVGTPPSSTPQTRQHRLEQLTTQLLWRLQQSSPHHSSSATNVVLPLFPESVTELQPPPQPAKLLHGLEESQGALYEIGVADDGTLVGLSEDEMQESLNNLRAMAACLGCVVEVQRTVKVGTCDWTEDVFEDGGVSLIQHESELLVAEALVKPYLSATTVSYDNDGAADSPHAFSLNYLQNDTDDISRPAPSMQLRVSLTGATMSGKSSLLGALSTTTFDNGRGKSRLSMLKHRHEITSGITSSVTQELIGYKDLADRDVEVVNYATENVSSWIDMHASCINGRLVFISDSAGHPRYRRTTVRGLVGWDPHWALLCVPADDEGDSQGRAGSTPPTSEVLGPAASDVDLSAAHLDLCLRLGLPLVVLITKLDLASKTGLRTTLARILSTLKSAGRKPMLVPNQPGSISEDDLGSFSQTKLSHVGGLADGLRDNPTVCVPIVMTSAVHGAGFDNLHALLHQLPLPVASATCFSGSIAPTQAMFHIEDVYNKTLDSKALIVSGHLRRGKLTAGDELYLGPCSTTGEDSEDSDSQSRPQMANTFPMSRSFPGALRNSALSRARGSDQEWRKVKIASIRNLRLPVSSLLVDQVGTIGLQLADKNDSLSTSSIKVRKGMVLCEKPGTASSSLVAQFRREDLGSLAVGSQVVLYIASVRASARVLSCRIPEAHEMVTNGNGHVHEDAPFDGSRVAGAVTHHFLLVTLHFDASKEYVERGFKILVMPGGGPGLFGGTERGEKGIAGLEGFVGHVVEVHS